VALHLLTEVLNSQQTKEKKKKKKQKNKKREREKETKKERKKGTTALTDQQNSNCMH
jgi:hypothetical protein